MRHVFSYQSSQSFKTDTTLAWNIRLLRETFNLTTHMWKPTSRVSDFFAYRDRDRDVSEKIALGLAQPTGQDMQFDQRLFNQTAGMDSGFGAEDGYSLYDKPLFQVCVCVCPALRLDADNFIAHMIGL